MNDTLSAGTYPHKVCGHHCDDATHDTHVCPTHSPTCFEETLSACTLAPAIRCWPFVVALCCYERGWVVWTATSSACLRGVRNRATRSPARVSEITVGRKDTPAKREAAAAGSREHVCRSSCFFLVRWRRDAREHCRFVRRRRRRRCPILLLAQMELAVG